MPIPSGVILIWPGTNASIPTGWVRETSLDDKFPKHSGAENPNVTGGSNTHTHSGSHGHTLTPHSHNYDLGSSGDFSGASTDGTLRLSSSHTHSTTATTDTYNGSLQAATVLWASANNEPPHHKVIFIKPSGVVASLVSNIIAHYNGASLPLGYAFCNGSNGTPDLRNKYLKGASTGADAGTTGGSLSHSHDISHTHTVNPHYHTGNSAASNNLYGLRRGDDPLQVHAVHPHTHLVTLANTTDTINSYSNTNAGSTDSVEPAYKKLGAIQNISTGPNYKVGLIGLWLGSIANIPKNWVLCDGNNGTPNLTDKFIKIGADLSENGNTGGSNTHNHADVSHTHTSTGTHTHTGSNGGASAYYRSGGSPNDGITNWNHSHAVQNISSATPTYSNDNISASTVDNQPAYRTAAYIQLQKLPPSGAGLLCHLL